MRPYAVGGIFITIVSYLGVFWGIYVLRHVWINRRHQAIHKRRPRITAVLVIFFLLFACLYVPLVWWTESPSARKRGMKEKDIPKSAASSALFSILAVGAVFTHLLRTWLIHFDTKLSLNHMDGQWGRLLDTNMTQDWYMTNKSTLGRATYLGKFLGPALGVFILIELILWIFIIPAVPSAAFPLQIVEQIIVGICIIVIGVIQLRTPRFEDRWDIRREVMFLHFWGLMFLFLNFLLNVTVVGNEEFIVFDSMLVLGASFLIVFGLTRFPLKSVEENHKMHEQQSVQTLHDHPHDVVKFFSSMLINIEKLNEFMDRLMKEFSHETLLFCIECVQYKQFVMEASNSIDVVAASDFGLFPLAREIPHSSIVHGSETDIDDKIRMMCAKYVDHGSALEVNLSAACRSRLMEMSETTNLTRGVMVGLFDDAFVEATALMTDSYLMYVEEVGPQRVVY